MPYLCSLLDNYSFDGHVTEYLVSTHNITDVNKNDPKIKQAYPLSVKCTTSNDKISAKDHKNLLSK
jgi:hypothetical protein